MKVLCIDIEGGFGGSSRSLFESVREIVTHGIEIEVWCRKSGPVIDRYRAIGVACRHEPGLPHISSLPRFSRNLFAYGRFALNWRGTSAARARLLSRLTDFELLHLNHEGLFLLARWLRPRTATPITAHVRTYLPSTVFSRWQYRTLVSSIDGAVFITENELERCTYLAGQPVNGQVIYNIASAPSAGARAQSDLDQDPRFKVCVLSNYSFMRGIDRLVDVASALKATGSTNIVFVVAGDMRLRGTLPGQLGKIARNGGTLADFAAHQAVADMFEFVGHVSDPEPLLFSCHMLAKPTRESNPWGRDILEALAAGKPVISVGTYNRFVEDGVTGILSATFNPHQWAEEIRRLAQDKDRYRTVSRNALDRIEALCAPRDRGKDLIAFWQESIAARQTIGERTPRPSVGPSRSAH